MEASVATPGTPAVASPAQTQAPTPATPEPAAPAATPAQVPVPPAPENDIEARLKAMEQRVIAAETALQGQSAPDFLSALSGESDDLGLTPEELAATQAEPQATPQGQDDQLAELDSYVNERIQRAVEPIVQQRQDEQVQAWQREHPDAWENEDIRNGILTTMDNLAARYGNEALKFDTDLLDSVYAAVKAKMADAGAVPAEAAANHGASIETQAGQTQTGEPSVDESYIQALMGGSSGGDAFR